MVVMWRLTVGRARSTCEINMNQHHRALAALVLLLSTITARAEPGMDCPLATQPYSADTVIIDLLLDPATRAVIQQEAPQLLEVSAAVPDLSVTPGFGAIFGLRNAASWVGVSDAAIERMDRALKMISVTPAATRARCARYDQVAPVLPAAIPRPALLVFDKSTGFKDAASVDAATAALKAMALRRGWHLVFSDNGAVFNPAALRRFDAVVWNNVSGDALTVPQEAAFRNYIEQGGGFAGIHGAGGDSYYAWDWYADTLIGARFLGHPLNPQFQAARVVVEDGGGDLIKGLGDGWTMTEEWYSFTASPRTSGARILARIDETTYAPGAKLAMGDHPVAWTRNVGKGRAFYTAIGHLPHSYAEPNSVTLLERGIGWTIGNGATAP
jgi:type 1 glutamine amidotransferase